MPTLRLLVTMQEMPSLDRINQAESKTLENLLVQKILMPSRASFFNSKSYSNAERSDDPPPSSIDLLAPMAKALNAKVREGIEEAKTLQGLRPTSLFFHIAVQSLPRITPKQRSVEDSWLQDLFYRILRHVFHIGAADALFLSSTQHILTINQMLRDIADHNIRISTSKLEPLLAHIMSCSDETLDASAICELTSLSILIDSNIFLDPAPIAKDGQENHLRVHNHCSAALLFWITNSAWKKSLEMDPIYEVKLSKVVTPLVEAFAKARNLLGFVSSWQEQLALCQKQRSDQLELVARSYRPRTLWEDERLMQLVARLAESALTAGQINHMLLEAQASVISHEKLGSDGYPNLMANLVLLDCAIGINLNDARSDQIKDTARDVYHSTLDWLLNKTHWPEEHKWRLWRILIAFNKRWYLTENYPDIRFLEQQVISKAVELTTRVQFKTPNVEDSQSGYAEELYAFAFVISSISGQKKPGEDDERPSHDLIETVIQWISKYGARERNDEKQDQIASTENSEPVIQWNGQSDGVTALDILHLCYLAQFLVFPGSLRLEEPSLNIFALSLTVYRFLKVAHQHQIFQNIYRGAIAFGSSSQPEMKPYESLSTPINYLSLWRKLANMELLQENRALTGSEPLSCPQ